MHKMVVVAIIAMLCGVTSSAEACSIRGENWQFGQTVSFNLTAEPDERCIHATRVFGRSVVENVRIGRKPRHGQANVEGTSWAYRSAKGFKGEDSFSVLIRGHSLASKGTTTINVSVSVQ